MKYVAALALAGLALAACGGGDDTGAATPTPDVTEPAGPTTAASAATTTPAVTTAATDPAPDTTTPAAGPVTIEHVYGSTTVEGVPARIVSLNMQWTDVVTALGHPPMAATTDPYFDNGWYPWQQTDGIEQISVGADLSTPFETIAALQPDLILASWGVATDQDYATLSAIAPTIPLLDVDRTVDPWEELAEIAGQILDEPDAATELVAAADRTASELFAELPGLEGKTYTLANYYPGDQIYVVADPDDGASQLFAKIGLQIDPDLVALDAGGFGRVELSFEQIGELDADVLLLLTNGTDTADIVGYDALPAVQSGAVALLEYPLAVALNTPSPLSIPYSLDYVRPALEAAAAG